MSVTLEEFNNWISAFMVDTGKPKLVIIGPQSARAIVRSVERMPASDGAPRRPAGNAHQRRIATRAKVRMWEMIKDLATYATDKPQYPEGSVAGMLERTQ